MSKNTSKQGVLFKTLSSKPLTARFDQAHASSDGGALLLKSVDQSLGLSRSLVGCLNDPRQTGKVRHDLRGLFQQRMYAIACGYPDGNDAARLSTDPVFKLLSDRDPLGGTDLASQSTLSRFENAVSRGELVRLASALAQCVIDRHARRRRKTRLITLDFDPTADPTYGSQQLSLFSHYYDRHCYLPLVGCLSFDQEPDQYLFSYLLRDGHAKAKKGLLSILKRLLPRLRKAFPKARIRIRLDAGFTGPELWEYFESERLEYVVCMPKNALLERLIEPAMADLRAEADGAADYDEVRYRARSWHRPRRIIMRAQVLSHPERKPKDNPRFILTNLRQSPRYVYEKIYCARGDMENRIKELKDGLAIDRTSCTSFMANQFRGLLTAAAYILMQELRLKAQGTRFARAQVGTLREHLLKLGAWFESSVRRFVVHLPSQAPSAREWKIIARSIGAVPT